MNVGQDSVWVVYYTFIVMFFYFFIFETNNSQVFLRFTIVFWFYPFNGIIFYYTIYI